MDHNNPIGEMLEKGQSLATSQVKKVVATTQQQLANNQTAVPDSAKAADAFQTQDASGIEQSQSQQSPLQTQAQASANSLQQLGGTHQISPDDQARIKVAQDKLKLEMHKTEYFNPTFNRPKPKEEPITEKIEREEQEDLWKKQQEESKKREADEPLAVYRAKRKGELNRGASG